MTLLKTILFALSFVFFQSLFSQSNAVYLDANNVNTRIDNRGSLFNSPQQNAASYETPQNGGNHLIYQGAFWFGGTNQNGDLKLASHLYGLDHDYYGGPFSTTNAYSDSAYMSAYNIDLWFVSGWQIANHISDYDQPGYVAPHGILNWPGNGDPTLGVAAQLAPYVDVDSNGVYEPHLGDYPCIKGDAAVYQILHEDLAHEHSGGEKIGAEIHIMVYQFVATNYINNTTFVETTVFNRGQNSFNDFKVSFFIDTDIGFAEDDYIGSAPAKNLVYSYNGTDFDSGQGAGSGFGTNPPAVGIVSLNKDVEYSGTFYRPDLGDIETSDPITAVEYWNYMNGKWKDGTDWTLGGIGYGGTNGSTQHMFDGNPNQGTGWSEENNDGNGSRNTPSDRRLLMTTEEESFLPGDKLTYNYAIITNRQGDRLENVDGLINYADSVQQFYNSTNTLCTPNTTLGLNDELEIGKLNIYPNPTTNKFTVVWEGLKVDEIKITSYNGSLIKSISVNAVKGEKVIDVNGLSSGVYFVNIGNVTRKLIIQ